MKIFLKTNFHKIIFVFSCLSLFISFFFNEDGTGGGSRGDFEVTYGFIIALQDNLLSDPKDWTLVHTPLHFILLSFVTKIITNTDLLRFLFCFFSLSLSVIFYLYFVKDENNKDYKSNILILSSIILFIPSFRYTSIWANDLITSLFFFIISIYFFKKWEKDKKKDIDKNSFLQIIFLALATYTRQYFAVFFIYFLFRYYQIFSLKSFIKLFLICVLTSIPVLYYTYLFPELLTGQLMTFRAIKYFLIGNPAIIAITLFPIILINLFYKKIPFNKIIIPISFSVIIVLILSLNFDPFDNWQGGGVSHLISKKIFSNNSFLYFSTFFTIATFIYMGIENKNNILLLVILILMFFSLQVYQRYYDPMFFIIFFTLIKTDLVQIFFKKISATLLLLSYFIIYYYLSASDLIYLL